MPTAFFVIVPAITFLILLIEYFRKPSVYAHLIYLIGFHLAIEIVNVIIAPGIENIHAMAILVMLETFLSLFVLSKILNVKYLVWGLITLGILTAFLLYRFYFPAHVVFTYNHFIDLLAVRGFVFMLVIFWFLFFRIKFMDEAMEYIPAMLTISAFLFFYCGIFYFVLFGRYFTTSEEVSYVYSTVYDPLYFCFYSLISFSALWRLKR